MTLTRKVLEKHYPFLKTVNFWVSLHCGEIRSIVMVLLHEVRHVQQYLIHDPILVNQEMFAIEDAGTKKRHNESWLEQDADEFARKEIKKFKNLTKIKL